MFELVFGIFPKSRCDKYLYVDFVDDTLVNCLYDLFLSLIYKVALPFNPLNLQQVLLTKLFSVVLPKLVQLNILASSDNLK